MAELLHYFNISLAEFPQRGGEIMALAYDRDPDVVDHSPGVGKIESGTAARMAAEKSRQKFEELGASTAQAAALVEAIRLILVGDVDRAQEALRNAEFSPDEIEIIFPHLLSGLQRAA
jgi:hypothetical protein